MKNKILVCILCIVLFSCNENNTEYYKITLVNNSDDNIFIDSIVYNYHNYYSLKDYQKVYVTRSIFYNKYMIENSAENEIISYYLLIKDDDIYMGNLINDSLYFNLYCSSKIGEKNYFSPFGNLTYEGDMKLLEKYDSTKIYEGYDFSIGTLEPFIWTIKDQFIIHKIQLREFYLEISKIELKQVEKNDIYVSKDNGFIDVFVNSK